jgi:D-3-phosphoglycerate dehydrogenase / 2-oxoglutarate reductase
VKLLLAESRGFPTAALATLQRAADVTCADLDRPGLLAAVRDADALWVRLRNRIDAELLEAAPRLKVLVTPTTGLNHIDLAETTRRGIQVLSLRGEADFLRDVRATAELTIGLILSLVRHIPAAAAHARAGGWNRDDFEGRELFGKTAGVVGYGRLGRIVARYLRAFDMQVLVSDPHLDAQLAEPGLRGVSLAQLLRQSDLITLHASLSDETTGFFGRREFQLMRPGAWFVNTGRGELIDEAALIEALESGRLAGAAVDVLCDENSAGMAGHRLVEYARTSDRLLITPHIGGCTVESLDKTETFLAEKLAAMVAAPAARTSMKEFRE